MKKQVIEKFNEVTEAPVEDYCRARDGGFAWSWFLQRARMKVTESGYLPQQGCLGFEPRYIETADAVLNGLLASYWSLESPNVCATKVTPWQRTDIELWKQLALTFSAMMFDAGCIAALTWGCERDFDPIRENGPAAIFGDVGFLGLRKKSLDFLKAIGGAGAVDIAAEIGDCCCSHLYADRNFVERAFKETEKLREAYFRGVCKAAYVAGATFASLVRGGGVG